MEYSKSTLSSFRCYAISKQSLNNHAANSKVLVKDDEGRPMKNKKHHHTGLLSESFASIFIKGNFNWSDVKEDVK